MPNNKFQFSRYDSHSKGSSSKFNLATGKMVAPTKRKRAALLVLKALKESRDPRLLTMRNIAEYVCMSSNMRDTQARRTVQAVLKKGIDFGIISKRRNGLYELTDMMKFARPRRRLYYPTAPRRRRSRRRHHHRKPPV